MKKPAPGAKESILAGGSEDEPADDALAARLGALSKSLEGQSKSLDAQKGADESPSSVGDATMAGAVGLGARVLTEFVAGVGVGAVIGWLLDKWLHTSPALLIVFLALGTAAGFWNVYRLAAKPTTGTNAGKRDPL